MGIKRRETLPTVAVVRLELLVHKITVFELITDVTLSIKVYSN